MYCPKCGNTLNEGAAFCPKCGNAINKPLYEMDNTMPRKKEVNIKGIVVAFVLLIAILSIAFIYESGLQKS